MVHHLDHLWDVKGLPGACAFTEPPDAIHADGRRPTSTRNVGPSATDREQEQLASVAREVGPEIASSAHPAARWLMARHKAAGDTCVVLSASPQELVEAVGHALGADRAVGTRTEVVDGRLTGRLDGPFCHGPGKLERLEAELGQVDLAGATAYADSGSDLPLLAACGRPVAVNPDRRLRRAATSAGWPVLRLG